MRNRKLHCSQSQDDDCLKERSVSNIANTQVKQSTPYSCMGLLRLTTYCSVTSLLFILVFNQTLVPILATVSPVIGSSKVRQISISTASTFVPSKLLHHHIDWEISPRNELSWNKPDASASTFVATKPLHRYTDVGFSLRKYLPSNTADAFCQ